MKKYACLYLLIEGKINICWFASEKWGIWKKSGKSLGNWQQLSVKDLGWKSGENLGEKNITLKMTAIDC